MNTLILYDDTGKICCINSGTYEVPRGNVNHVEIEVPKNKIVLSVNPETKEPVYQELPPSRTDELEAKLEYLVMMTGINVEEV